MFIGNYKRKLDDKNRVVIPREFLDELGSTFVLVKNVGGYISLYSIGEYDKLRRAFDGQPPMMQRELNRKLNANSSYVDIDSQFRITIPEGFMNYLGLDAKDNVVILGCGEYAELWTEEACDVDYGKNDQDKDEHDYEIDRLLLEMGF